MPAAARSCSNIRSSIETLDTAEWRDSAITRVADRLTTAALDQEPFSHSHSRAKWRHPKHFRIIQTSECTGKAAYQTDISELFPINFRFRGLGRSLGIRFLGVHVNHMPCKGMLAYTFGPCLPPKPLASCISHAGDRSYACLSPLQSL